MLLVFEAGMQLSFRPEYDYPIIRQGKFHVPYFFPPSIIAVQTCNYPYTNHPSPLPSITCLYPVSPFIKSCAEIIILNPVVWRTT